MHLNCDFLLSQFQNYTVCNNYCNVYALSVLPAPRYFCLFVSKSLLDDAQWIIKQAKAQNKHKGQHKTPTLQYSSTVSWERL